MENKDSDEPIGIDEYFASFFYEENLAHLLDNGVKIYAGAESAVALSYWNSNEASIFILDEKKVRGFDKSNKTLTVQGEYLKADSLEDGYFQISGRRYYLKFFYREETTGDLHVFKDLIFRKNDFKGFNTNMLDSSLCTFVDNVISGTIVGLTLIGDREHRDFLENNKFKDGAEIGFRSCYLEGEFLKDKTITELKDVEAVKKLLFEGCTIKETNFNFGATPIVRFLTGNTIENITDVEKIKETLNEDICIGELFFSNDIKIGEKNSPEERQYFFRQIQKFQERDGEVVQAKFAYKKFLEEELKLENLNPSDKLIIGFSKLFGGGLSYLNPLFFLLVTFIALSFFYQELNPAILLPVFPNVFFAEENIDSLSKVYPHLYINIIQAILLYCYFLLLVSWYFLIKSLHKFTYKR